MRLVQEHRKRSLGSPERRMSTTNEQRVLRTGAGRGSTLLTMSNATTTTTTTLFERLGGQVSIDAAVDRFYELVCADPELAPFFDRVDMRRQRSHQRAFLAMALGGPRAYTGRRLGDAHRHLAIGDRHVDLVAGHLAAVLVELGVDADLVDEVVRAVDGLRADVLGRA
jgi:truncated hemoglobin YjbI